jgi:glycosyltransferase involved in cell wall biosynthesis
VLLESMACGTPVVVCDIPGIAEIVAAPEAGSIAPSATAAALAVALRERLAAAPDRARTRRYAEGFGWESTTHGQIALFSEILGQRPAARG